LENRHSDISPDDGIENLFRYRIHPERNLVVVKLLQAVTARDIARWELAMMQEPLFSPDMDGIIDQREASADLKRDDVTELAKLTRTTHKVKGRWVHLVDDPLPTAMAIQYKREVDGQQEVEAFSTTESASKFLDYNIEPYLAALEEKNRVILSEV